MAAVLVTLTQAKRQCRIAAPDGDPDDADLQMQLDAAEAAVVTYLKREPVGRSYAEGWIADPLTAPVDVQHAILGLCNVFWWNRGNTPELQTAPLDPHSELPVFVMSLIRRWTAPVVL